MTDHHDADAPRARCSTPQGDEIVSEALGLGSDESGGSASAYPRGPRQRGPRLRFMQQVADGHWVIQCRACGKRRSKHHFDRALDCHEYWRDHVKTKEHLGNIDPNHFDERDAAQFATEELLRKIFGVSS